ncbi:HD-GYP domain-containing protein [Teredinibacter sp. KSP-S5-2]|uniref:HD-GYP domain-containing protein n=1 Tax=Teredinibacter sp. KSP-S5-2 TaxID=3034506 RepID=UPI002934DFFE|nr:HD domain-containing phosphohydrolase [Teredinibacter sp. KSP-S5-2]WNO08714.1 HD domain-containing phosphohydrolase [Teredinibacter sp. KSP-S5-2]
MDAYATHLAEVNEVQDVIALENICNAQGQLIIPKGSKIDAKAAEKVIKFKLLKPIENTVAIDKELNHDRLKSRFTSFLSTNPDFVAIQQYVDLTKELEYCCEKLCQHDILRQKITVLALQLPKVFNQAMFCAWFSMAINKQEGVDDKVLEDGFIASMTHDLGFLHISPELLNKEEPLSEAEYKQLHSHPLVGEKIVESLPGISKDVARAIAEHHENLDGSGYPKGKVGKQLCYTGRLLNMLDSVNAVYSKHFKPRSSSLHDLVPIIQMNEQAMYGKSARSLICLLKKTRKSDACSIPENLIPELIDNVKNRNNFIVFFVEATKDFISQLGLRHENAKLFALQNSFLHINITLAQSGIANEAYLRWLDQVKEKKIIQAYREVEDVFLMMGEVCYHISRFKRQLRSYSILHPNTEAGKIITLTLERLEKRETPKASQNLSHLWLAQVAC